MFVLDDGSPFAQVLVLELVRDVEDAAAQDPRGREPLHHLALRVAHGPFGDEALDLLAVLEASGRRGVALVADEVLAIDGARRNASQTFSFGCNAVFTIM